MADLDVHWQQAGGGHPRLAQLLAQATPATAQAVTQADPAARYADMLARVMVGVLGA